MKFFGIGFFSLFFVKFSIWRFISVFKVSGIFLERELWCKFLCLNLYNWLVIELGYILFWCSKIVNYGCKFYKKWFYVVLII